MKKVFVVLNPVAGQSEPDILRDKLQEYADHIGWSVHLHEMNGEERLDEVLGGAREQGFDLFVAAGGDGTVAGVAGALAGTGVPFAILPVGTGNVLARDLGVPLEVDDALRLIFEEHVLKKVDAGRSGDQLFILNLSAGASARVMRDVQPEEKRRFGFLAYAWQGIQKLFGAQLRTFTLVVDGQEYRQRATEVLVMNSNSIGSPNITLGADVQMDDGQIEVYLVRTRTLGDYLNLIWNAIIMNKRRAPTFRRLVARDCVSITADRSLPVQADGEFIGHTPVAVQIMPGAVTVVVPPAVEGEDRAGIEGS